MNPEVVEWNGIIGILMGISKIVINTRYACAVKYD